MKFNINFLISQLLVETLSKMGLRHVCLSPGSRNTPLTLAFARNESINNRVFVDERSSAFFALGIAKTTGLPVAVVCTSGTAAAELYPAIVEAYTAQVPLLIITADRPDYLKNTGSNQTINQTKIYSANCDYFFDPGIPETSLFYLQGIVEMGTKAFKSALTPFHGPVHINLPFEKPLEPSSWNCDVTESELNSLHSLISSTAKLNSIGMNDDTTAIVRPELGRDDKVVIIVANKHYKTGFFDKCALLSLKQNIPVCIEAALDIGGEKKLNFINNLGNMLQSPKFIEKFNPEKIIIFGRNPISKNLERYLNKSEASLFCVNSKGENFGKAAENKTVVRMDENDFIESLLDLETNSSTHRIYFYKEIQKYEEKYRREIAITFKENNFDSEVGALAILAKEIASNNDIPVFISNSLPIRDYDFLKQFFLNPIHSNRGASGIDGIISTASGISSGNGSPAVLVIGDLSFHYDSNALHNLKKYQIPLLIVLMNNQGGSIFEYLPVYSENEEFNTYFKTETDIDFGSLTKAYGIDYQKVDCVSHFRECIGKFLSAPKPVVIELKFDSQNSKTIKDILKSEILNAFENG